MSLPSEIDFEKDRSASPERMNKAMNYLDARFRALEAIHPEFQSIIDELTAVGLQRVTDALIPIFDHAQDISDAIDAIKSMWEQDSTVEAVEQQVTENVVGEFSDYRVRYLGAKAEPPAEDDEGNPVTVGTMYFDTSKDAMQVLGATGWKNAGSAVAGVMEQIDPIIAEADQTTFTIPGGYDIGYLILTINGAVMPETDYTATNGETVIFDDGLSDGDELAGVKFGAVTLTTVYNKTQANDKFRAKSDSYSKSEVDAQIGSLTSGKANTSDVYTKTQSDGRYAKQDFSNITNTAAARSNLGVGSAGTKTDDFFLRAGSGLGGGTVTRGTAAPSGGADGDVYLRYNA